MAFQSLDISIINANTPAHKETSSNLRLENPLGGLFQAFLLPPLSPELQPTPPTFIGQVLLILPTKSL